MEKSIETIWKEGFLKDDAKIAPQLNNLYNQKSKHIVDKYKRMFKTNILAVVIGSFIVLAISILLSIPIMGIGVFITLNIMAVVDKKLLPGLESIDKTANSYEYLKSVKAWMELKSMRNRDMATYYYPMFFLSAVLGLWFSSPVRNVLDKILLEIPHEIYIIYGVPVFWVIPVILISILLSYFGGRLYDWDLKMVYGPIIQQHNELLHDMEELRQNLLP